MGQDLKLTIVSPEAARQKLASDEPPPGFRGPTGSFGFEPSSVTLAKRLDKLDDKTVYLVDIGFGGGYNFMLEVQRWFADHMPSVNTVVRRKPGHVFMDVNNHELWEEIKEKGNAVILGVAG